MSDWPNDKNGKKINVYNGKIVKFANLFFWLILLIKSRINCHVQLHVRFIEILLPHVSQFHIVILG